MRVLASVRMKKRDLPRGMVKRVLVRGRMRKGDLKEIEDEEEGLGKGLDEEEGLGEGEDYGEEGFGKGKIKRRVLKKRTKKKVLARGRMGVKRILASGG